MINKEKVIEELQLKPFGAKKWFSSNLIQCNNCGTQEKFGILFTSDGGITHCFKCSTSGSLYNFLVAIDRKDLIQFERNYSLQKQLSSLTESETPIDLTLSIKTLPLGYSRIYFDDYLEERGFEAWQYNYYNVGTSTERRLKDCIIFVIKNSKNEVIAWLSRSKFSKEWHEQNLKDYKEGKADLKLRYTNSENTDFSKILLGENEITENTNTLILCEGLFDKANIDRCFNLRENKEMKAVVTFGNSLTNEQVQILIKYGIENLIFAWDQGTISSTQHSTMKISKYFKSIKVMQFNDKLIDAGNADKSYLIDLFNNAVDYFYLYKYKIGEIKLK